MEYRYLGRTGLKVSVLALGTMTFGGAGDWGMLGAIDDSGARRMVDIAIDAGVNTIDTANVYSNGLSEQLVGAAITGRRDRLIIGTKVRFSVGDGPNDQGLSRAHIIQSCEASLRRLGTDYIDIYQLHQWDGGTALDETLGALDLLVSQGKVRYVGVSNFTGWQTMKALAVATRDHLPRFACQQIHYSLQAREAEYELIPLSIDQGLGNLVWSPLAGGLLSGKYRRGRDDPAGSRQLTTWNEPPVYDRARLDDIVDELVAIASKYDVSPSEVALAYSLMAPGITSLILGARTEDQLVNNLKAAELTLAPDDYQRLNDVSRPPLLYPYWVLAGAPRDRLTDADMALLSNYQG